MAVKKINYNSKITSCMHRPVTSGQHKYVLYPKVKDYKGEVEGSTLAEKDPEYIKSSQLYSNSPTNIRQLFITGRRVYTYLYTGIEVPSNKKSESVFMKTYEDGDMFEIAQKILEYKLYSLNPSVSAMTKVIGEKEPDQYVVEGNIFGAIANPYTCNNIEEIYLDWTIFLSNDPFIKQCFGDNLVNASAINNFLTNNYSYSENNFADKIQQLVMNTCMGNTKNIRNRFPRLKMIAIITKLDELITSNDNILMLHTLDSELNSSNKDRLGKTWYELNRSRIINSGSMCFVCPIKGSDKTQFQTKENQYRFDKTKLKPKVDIFIAKLKEADRKARYAVDYERSLREDLEEEIKNLGSAEQYLVQLEEKYGLNHVKNVLAIAITGATKSELSTFFTEFTKQNRIKYSELVGYKL